MENKSRKRLSGFTCVLICFMGIILFTTWKFNKKITEIGIQAAQQELKSEAITNGHAIQTEYTNMTDSLTILAKSIASIPIKDQENLYKHILFLTEQLRFDDIGISDIHGNAMNSSGKKLYIGDRKYFKETITGKVKISDLCSSKTDQDVQIISVPIQKDDTIFGIVYGILNLKTVLDSLENTEANKIHTQIVNADGIPITSLKTDSWTLNEKEIWKYYEHCEFINGTPSQIKKDMMEQRSGYYILKCQDSTRITYYAPLGIGEYYIFSNLEVSPLKKIMNQIHENARDMAVGITLAFFILLISVYYFNKKISEELQKSYQVKVSSEEILRIAANQSNAFVFEYDQEKKILRRKTEKENFLFPEEIISNVPESIIQRGIISPNSVNVFQNAFLEISQQENVSVTIEILSKEHTKWYQILMKNIYDSHSQIINTVGSVSDVSEIKKQEKRVLEERKKSEAFQKKAEKDGLTGLYNASTACEKINNFLANADLETAKHILVFMDLDNFKEINDTFGHHFGNQVLVDISRILSSTFRHDDIIARFGGDEFAVFLKNTAGFEKMEHIFQDLVEACDKTYEKNGKKVNVSASFGIAVAPDHGLSFEELSHKADQMLYEVKRNNKKGYKLYHL